jgi:hypothetical protein
MSFTRKPALKHQGLADQMSLPVSNPIASSQLIYIMPRYASPMPYLPMPYPYAMPLAIPALTSPSLPTRQSSTPSSKAKIQLPIRQNSPIAPAEDPNLIMKQMTPAGSIVGGRLLITCLPDRWANHGDPPHHSASWWASGFGPQHSDICRPIVHMTTNDYSLHFPCYLLINEVEYAYLSIDSA